LTDSTGNMLLAKELIGRTFAGLTNIDSVLCAPNFTLWPQFFAAHEQHTLLVAALKKLDDMETRRARRQMKEYQTNLAPSPTKPALQSLFLPDSYYDFQEGHYDGVIHHFREMHLTSWPEDEVAGLSSFLKRLYGLCPTPNTQTHLLHLASYGEILPHVDNTSASGSWIMGVSLGGERVLRMEGPNGDTFDVTLPSGSVYLQRDSMRFQYKHSILKRLADGSDGQRLSIMIRDLPRSSAICNDVLAHQPLGSAILF